MKRMTCFLTAMLLGFALFGTGCKTAQNAISGSTSQPAGSSSQPSSMLQTGAMGVAALIKLLGGSDAKAKATAKQQLLAMGAKAVPPLIQALRGKSASTQKGALDVLGKMGKKASSATDAVTSLTKSTDASVAKAANDTLSKIK